MTDRGDRSRFDPRGFYRAIAVRWHRWIERTDNLLTLSVLVVLPVLIGGVTLLANHEPALPFLLFPPLASGGYSLFADPGAWRRDVRRFVGGLSVGAASGWLALEAATAVWYQVPATNVHAGAVALGVLVTALVTLALDLQAPAAFSTALLVHVSGPGGVDPVGYVTSVIAGSLIVAGAYVVWRRGLYDRRAGLLYESIEADDQVLVPVYGETATATATLGARIAGAHDAGRVVLCGLLDGTDPPAHPASDADSVDAVAEDLERIAAAVTDRVGTPVDVVVARGRADRILRVAHDTDCDLIVAPAVYADEGLAPFVRALFQSDLDVLVHDSRAGRTEWNRVLVPVRRASDVAHSMIDFADRLVGSGAVSVCRCVDAADERPTAERAIERLITAFDRPIETRVAVSPLETFLDAYASQYDLVVIGASRDRSLPSRILSPPTYRRLAGIDTDLAIVDRNYRS
ncbi:HPP family protein [Halococcoides cellulosivorans]|uniref:Universal stress protein UspA n=1 Tax=Halococcoides cellulosivorans TaxID=1679096 RepID=A0A2R4WYQ4_9EURY|nr:HPP family protein [Halococcoides cellulosivorans]AWB26673.1 universal stress protein UspA [Halococcoides cellulosivorans]